MFLRITREINKDKRLRVLIVLATLLSVSVLQAQTGGQPDYLNPALPAERRAQDLVHHMTVEEKVTRLVNQSRAIPRLNVPDYDWWSEASYGIATNGTTEFPNPVGLAATFDTDAIHQMAIVIGTEGRIKHVQGMRDGHSEISEGLDFWAPNINIFRDPRWGRGQETFGEDPFLTPTETGDYRIGLRFGGGFARVFVDGKQDRARVGRQRSAGEAWACPPRSREEGRHQG